MSSLCGAPEGCSEPIHYKAARLCSRHYQRLRRTGSTVAYASNTPLADRLHRRLEPRSECIVWTGGTNGVGYGKLKPAKGDPIAECYTHRISWVLAHGPIPSGLEIDHLCRNRACCNPEHLDAVTRLENNIRAWAVNRADACPHGHDLTAPDSTYRWASTGSRRCKECHRARNRVSA